MFSKFDTWPQQDFFAIKVGFGLISSRGKAQMSMPTLRLFRGVSLFLPMHAKLTAQSQPCVWQSAPKCLMKAACGEGSGTSEIVYSTLTSANPHKSPSLRCRPTEHPGPIVPHRWTCLPCPWDFSLVCADDQQLKTKHDNRYRSSRLHLASFFKGV